IAATVSNATTTPGQLQRATTGLCALTSFVYPKGIGTDQSGNVVAAGLFQRTVDFGNNTGLLTSAGGFDAFIVKYNSQGLAQWVMVAMPWPLTGAITFSCWGI